MDFKLEKIHEDHFMPIGDFDCRDEESLSDYLKCEAYRDSVEGESVTFILSDKSSDEILGYFTLRCNSLQARKGTFNVIIPCIEISRFAVHWGYRRNRIGTALMKDGVMKVIKSVGEHVGVKGIMLFSLDEAVEFYEEFGFRKFDEDIQSDIQSLTETYSEDCCGMFALLDKDKKIVRSKEEKIESIV